MNATSAAHLNNFLMSAPGLASLDKWIADDVAAGVPLVGLEPGCLPVFKDELLKPLPDHALHIAQLAQRALAGRNVVQRDAADAS